MKTRTLVVLIIFSALISPVFVRAEIDWGTLPPPAPTPGGAAPEPIEVGSVINPTTGAAGSGAAPGAGSGAAPGAGSGAAPGAGSGAAPAGGRSADLEAVVINVRSVIWSIFVGLSVIMFIFAGILFLTSSGQPEPLARAKKTFLYGVVAILVAVLAYSIMTIIRLAVVIR